MKPKYLFRLCYRAPHHEDASKQILCEEFIIAETWEQAREYWAREFDDASNEITMMERVVPVVAICPEATKTRYAQ